MWMSAILFNPDSLEDFQDEAAAHRLAHRGMKRSVLGAGIAASKEVLTPGLKTPYSPRHVMTPRGPMVVGPEGPVAPSQHPFVQEQMTILKCIRQVSPLFRYFDASCGTALQPV